MADKMWCRDFVSCRLPNTGKRFNETVEVLVKKLEEVQDAALQEAAKRMCPLCDAGEPVTLFRSSFFHNIGHGDCMYSCRSEQIHLLKSSASQNQSGK